MKKASEEAGFNYCIQLLLEDFLMLDLKCPLSIDFLA